MNRTLTLLILTLLLLTSASATLEGFQNLAPQEYYYVYLANHTIAQVDYNTGDVNWMTTHGASTYQMLSDGRLFVRQTSTGDVFIYEPDGTLTLQTWNSPDRLHFSLYHYNDAYESVPYRTIMGNAEKSSILVYFSPDGTYDSYGAYKPDSGTQLLTHFRQNAHFDRTTFRQYNAVTSGSTMYVNTYSQHKLLGNGSASSTSYSYSMTADAVSTTTTTGDHLYTQFGTGSGIGGTLHRTQIRAFQMDSDGGTPDTLWTVTLPADSGVHDLMVWGANQNRLFVAGSSVSADPATPTVTGTASYLIYSRDGTVIGGSTLQPNTDHGNTYYTQPKENDAGEMMVVEVRSESDNVVRIFPVFGTARVHTFDESVSSFSVMKRSDQARSGRQLGMFRFSALPTMVYEFFDDPTFTLPEGLTFNNIDTTDKYVELTLTDQVVNNVPVEMIFGSGIPTPSTRFAVEAHYPELVSAYNTSVFTTQGESNTTTLPFGNATDYEDFYEVVVELDMENTDSGEDYSEIKLEFSNDFYESRGFGTAVSETFLIRRYNQEKEPVNTNFLYTTGGTEEYRNARDGVYVYFVDSTGAVKLVAETTTGNTATNIDLIRVRFFIDRTSLTAQAKVQARLEVERTGTMDTVASSTWFATQMFDRYFPSGAGNLWTIEGNITNLTITQNTTNTQSQASVNIYTYDEPQFGTWYASDVVDGALRNEAYILEGGANTIRVYSALNNGESAVIDSVSNYEEWTVQVNLDNSVILGVPPTGTFDPTTPTTPTDPAVGGEGTDWLQPIGGFSLAQSTFIYTVGVILLTWLIIVGYSIYVSNLTGSPWVTSVGVVLAALTSILWVFVAVFIGWLPVWVVVLMILLGAGIATMIFRNTFMGGG